MNLKSIKSHGGRHEMWHNMQVVVWPDHGLFSLFDPPMRRAAELKEVYNMAYVLGGLNIPIRYAAKGGKRADKAMSRISELYQKGHEKYIADKFPQKRAELPAVYYSDDGA